MIFTYRPHFCVLVFLCRWHCAAPNGECDSGLLWSRHLDGGVWPRFYPVNAHICPRWHFFQHHRLCDTVLYSEGLCQGFVYGDERLYWWLEGLCQTQYMMWCRIYNNQCYQLTKFQDSFNRIVTFTLGYILPFFCHVYVVTIFDHDSCKTIVCVSLMHSILTLIVE